MIQMLMEPRAQNIRHGLRQIPPPPLHLRINAVAHNPKIRLRRMPHHRRRNLLRIPLVRHTRVSIWRLVHHRWVGLWIPSVWHGAWYAARAWRASIVVRERVGPWCHPAVWGGSLLPRPWIAGPEWVGGWDSVLAWTWGRSLVVRRDARLCGWCIRAGVRRRRLLRVGVMGSLGLSVGRPPFRGRMGAALRMKGGSYSTLKSRFHRGGVVGGARGMMEAFAGGRPGLCLHTRWPFRCLRPVHGAVT